ncbi:MAG: alpha/beta hydrolase-fold protein [Chloroflexota bacterium]
MTRRLLILPTFLLTFLLVCACDPLAPVIAPTPQIVIVTPSASETIVPTATRPPTITPQPSSTPQDTPTPTQLPCLQNGGQIVPFDDFRSPTAGENLRYRVYIPPCYLETQKRYPYVILLHGLQEDELQWGDLGIQAALDQGIRLGALAPMIVVMPDMGAIGTENTFPPADSYETVVLDELIPAVERDFCTWNNRDYRAIGGISRGGFWAYSIALRHPDIFGIVGGHSASFDPGNAPPAFNPLELALNAPFLANANLRMYLDNGADDVAGTNLELFSSRLSSRGIAHTYIISPVGGHDDEYWTAHLQDYLTFYARDWSRSVDDLPSCLQPSP